MIALRIEMPSQGDMKLIDQTGGTIDLAPVFFNGESSGPHLQIIEMDGTKQPRVMSRYRLRVKNNRLQLIEGVAQ